MDTTPETMVRLIRHHGSILPFCEVVHIVHPRTAFHLVNRGSPPGVSEQAWERVKKAVSGENVSPHLQRALNLIPPDDVARLWARRADCIDRMLATGSRDFGFCTT